MADQKLNKNSTTKGLPLFTSPASKALAEEKAVLVELDKKSPTQVGLGSLLKRWCGYFPKTGPGWMMSGMVLGMSIYASLIAGVFLQYQLLWVQPLAMILGLIMLSALAHQTLVAGERPFQAMKKFLHPWIAWSWVIVTLIITINANFPLYTLSAGMMNDMIKAYSGWQITGAAQNALLSGLGVLILFFATAVCWIYGSGGKKVRFFEKVLQAMILMILLAFTVIVIQQSIAGKIAWGKVIKGFLPINISINKNSLSIIIGMFGSVVGMNMLFFLGYSFLARGWTREHRGLAKFDLITGLLIPYILCTSLLIIIAGSSLYNTGLFASESLAKLSPMVKIIKTAGILETTGIPAEFSRILFGLAVVGMGFISIILHMLVCGFAVCEIFGLEPGGWKFKMACLIPAPAMLGVIPSVVIGFKLKIFFTAIHSIILLAVYIGLFILNNSGKYLKEDKPKGKKAVIWNAAMLLVIFVSLSTLIYFFIRVSNM